MTQYGAKAVDYSEKGKRGAAYLSLVGVLAEDLSLSFALGPESKGGGKLVQGLVEKEAKTVGDSVAVKLTAEDLLAQVRAADFVTPRDAAVFWTGYPQGNQAVAMRWADANGKFTIEMTPGGRILKNLDLYGPNSLVTREEADAIWRAASERFASGASGRVTAFTKGTIANPDSVFYDLELRLLRQNPNVTRTITYRGY